VRLVLALLTAVAAASAPPADSNAARATASYVAMQRAFYDPRAARYRETAVRSSRSTLWPVSQAIAASVAVAALPGAHVGPGTLLRRVLPAYRLPRGYRATLDPDGDLYYDDNVWIALDLLDWNAVHRDSAAVQRALRLYGLVVAAWDDDASHPCPGGVFWTRARRVHDRNTVTTAGGALLGMRLYALLHRPQLLRWSMRMTDWVDACLAAPNGLYWDHVRLDGSIVQRQWSYNQGAMIGANVLLAQATGDASALEHAKQIADVSLQEIPLAQEPPEFVAIFFRNLLLLGDAVGDGRYRAAAQAYADAAWTSDRDPRTGLFRSKPGPARLLEQAALTQLYALLAKTGP